LTANSEETARPWRRAGLLRRLAAICYDLLLILALFMVLAFAVILLRTGDAVDAGSGWFQLLLVLVWWFYFSWSWTHGGQTIGMLAWRMRLQQDDGNPVHWRAAGLRFLGAGLSMLALGLGFLWCLFDRDGLGWHDRLSRTELRYLPKTSADARPPAP
jgi:uncharacterized RDD family membrane protein YckC